MRVIFTLSLLFTFSGMAFAQPANDECDNAMTLNLDQVTPCPNSSPVVNNFALTNVGATPVSPYPSLTGCQGDGDLDGPAAEVWYSFTPSGQQITFDITGGLNTPNIVLFSGQNCGFLQAVNCASANPNSGTLSATFTLIAGQTYFLMISGGDINDQGAFNLTVTGDNDCTSCLGAMVSLNPSPAPTNGTYSSGQVVSFCFTIEEWTVTTTDEWLHSVTVEFGAGWDVTTLNPTPPPSCDGNGFWAWSDSWVGCNTGQTFGPGFVYESNAGVDNSPNCNTGGTPGQLDGNPGNNFGDGANGCSTITPINPTNFCWTIAVQDCPPNFTANDLNISVQAFSDGDSGSWTGIGCNSGLEFPSLASAICCDDDDPIYTITPISCPGDDDATISMEANEGNDPLGLYNFTLFDSNNNIVFECMACSGIQTVSNLSDDTYTINIENVLTACVRSTFPVIDPATGPSISILPIGLVCEGDDITLTAVLNPADNPLTFAWTGPNGFTANTASITVNEPGTYTVTGSADGCAVTVPASVDFTPDVAILQIIDNDPDNAVCDGETVTFEAIGATNNLMWVNVETGQNLGSANPIDIVITATTTLMATGVNANNCPADATSETITVSPNPELTLDIPNPLCADDLFVVSVSGADTYEWSDGITSNQHVFTLPEGTFQLEVTGTDATTGCSTDTIVEININATPTPTISPLTPEICAGNSIVLTASGLNFSNFQWSTGENNVSSITVSPIVTTTYMVTESLNGCEGTAEVIVSIEDPLPAPVITCGANTAQSVIFNWPAITGANGYDITVNTGQMTGVLTGTDPLIYTVTGLDPSEDVTITVTATGGDCGGTPTTFTCTSMSCPPLDMDITPVGDICLVMNSPTIQLEVTIGNPTMDGDSLWNGTGVIDPFVGVFDPNIAGAGAHQVIFTYTEGLCAFRDTITINVFDTPTATFDVDPNLVCVLDPVMVTYTGNADIAATYTWDFDGGTANTGTGQGPHTVNWASAGDKTISLFVSANGCTAEIFTQNITADAPLAGPAILCGMPTTTSVEFNWGDVPGADGYIVDVTTGQVGTLTGTTFTVNGLQPEESVTITVFTQDDGPCENSSTTMTCAALACPGFSLVIDPVANICLVANAPVITMTGMVTGGLGDGNITWSGNGIVGAVEGLFAPSAAGVGTHTITMTYTEGPCPATETMDITIFETPTANFMASVTTVCIGDETTLTYTGNASAAATYNWNFSGGDAVTGVGQGPHTVSWLTAGAQTVSLTVTENGCPSEAFELDIQVESPLSAPVVNCDPSSTAITFTWDDIAGATGYNVTVQTGQIGIMASNSFTLTGLVPGEAVDITVEAIGAPPCGSSFTMTGCIAEDCPEVMIDIADIEPICLFPITVTTNIIAIVTGGLGSGGEVWDGPGIIDPLMGTFDPAIAGVGIHTINYTYSEGTCTYNSSTTVTVNSVPEAAFTAEDPVCLNAINNISFTGSAGATATYDWNFDSGIIVSGVDAGPYEITWGSSGAPNISLIVTENGCISEPFALGITVVDTIASPIISCESTDTSIIFSWMPITGADTYQVIGSAGILDGTTYTITGLLPGAEESITVIAETTNACGNTSTSATCIASDCAEVDLNITAPATVCADEGMQTFLANPQGGTGTGMGVWFGAGIVDGVAGTFNPGLVIGDTVNIQYIYTENVICVYDTIFSIIIYEIPDADFTVETPICIDGTSSALIINSAPTGSTFDWTFDSGTSTLPNTDQGPHTVDWATAGDKTVGLQISNNGCLSPIETQLVEVVDNLAIPVITCGISTTNTLTFTWDAIVGATEYQIMDIDGPTGELVGTTYTVSGLTPEQIVNIEVTAVSNGICGNTSQTATCQAMPCTPVTVEVAGPVAVCAGDDATVVFTITGSTADFNVTYSVNGGDPVQETISSGDGIDFTALSENMTVDIIAYSNAVSPECMYNEPDSWTIMVNETLDAGVALAPVNFCMNTNETIQLAEMIEGADDGGEWVETSDISSLPGGFNANAGTFAIANQIAGTYRFAYQLTSAAPCPMVETEVSVVIDPLPAADAGEDQTIFCNMGLVSIGGNGSSSGNGIVYSWLAPNGVILVNPTDLLTETGQEGTYELTVSNEFGCVATDNMLVIVEDDVPAGELIFNGISCFSANDGSILIQNVTGGTPPYSYSLNGEPFSTQTLWTGLTPGSFNLVINDANNCPSELAIDLTEPNELIVNLVTNTEVVLEDNVIEYGDSIQLEAIFTSSIPIDTIMWNPPSITTGEPTVWVNPTTTTSYSVTVIDENGCSDSDGMTIYVEKPRPVFIPNVFSPNDDGINDILFIWANNKQVVKIKSFIILNRWGESVFEQFDFQANDPTLGWDGKFRGKFMNPAVFVYQAEVEFTDGEVILYKGDISLVR